MCPHYQHTNIIRTLGYSIVGSDFGTKLCIVTGCMASVDDPNMPGETLSFCDDLHVMADFEIEERAPWMEIYPSHNMKVSPLISEFLSLISM